MPVDTHYQPATRIYELGPEFYDPVRAAVFPQRKLRFRNQRAAETIGLSHLRDGEWVEHFGEFEPLPKNIDPPLALRYHGHQFGVYNPDLGDGRGFLFAQVLDIHDGRLLDLGTKGSGQTPYSRGGDGRLTLKGAVRELLASEQLEALGVRTARTLSVIETGEQLIRNDEPSPTRSAVLVRLAHSHIRIGTFQRPAHHKKDTAIKELLEYCLRHYMPPLPGQSIQEKAFAFCAKVCENLAQLCAQWMVAGFVHGVLNTDNLNITGESFDYGPYRFLPQFQPEFTAAYFDGTGLYAFGRQPESVYWGLHQLTVCFEVLGIPQKELTPSLAGFEETLAENMVELFFNRLNLRWGGFEPALELMNDCYRFLEESGAGYAQFFHDFFGGVPDKERLLASPNRAFYRGEIFKSILTRFSQMPAVHPERSKLAYFRDPTPCDLLIDEIEAIWTAIDQRDDWRPLYEKLKKIDQFRLAFIEGKSQR